MFPKRVSKNQVNPVENIAQPHPPQTQRKSLEPTDDADAAKLKKHATDEHSEDAGAIKFAEELEKEKERQHQKDLERLEKELQKKLANHQHDSDSASNESIFIAPPAPDNKMSSVKLVDCGVRGYRICFLVCGLLMVLVVAITFGMLAIGSRFPSGFHASYDSGNLGSQIKFSDIFMELLQLIGKILWLSLVCCCATKSRFCGCKNNTYWCIRGYYAYSVYLLVIPCVLFLRGILYIGTLEYEGLEEVMEDQINTYEALNTSKENWDQTQTYFECCGINVENGWRDWQFRDKVDEDIDEWIVPASCCRKGLSKEDMVKCVNETTDELVWNKGCGRILFDEFSFYSNIVMACIVFEIVVHCWSVYFATKIYQTVRAIQDPSFQFRTSVYCVECCCCCRRCRPVVLVH